MKLDVIANSRLHNQQLTKSQFRTPKDLLGWMGAVQAQDYEMAKWAIGVRLPNSTREQIEKVIEHGEIIRTHALRPTWHFVSAMNLNWILDLTAPRIRIAIRSRQKQLGLTKEAVSKSNRVIAKALTLNKLMTRNELVQELENAGFKNEDNRASHLLINAELDKVICSGASKGKEYTYALFENRVPTSGKIKKEEALEKLASIYFDSHGPATLDDFVWWSGLTKTAATKALKMVETNFISEETNDQTYWFSDSANPPVSNDQTAYLLPAYDEFLVSYKSRESAIRLEDQKKAISNNGLFRPIIVVNGEVVGIWKRSIQGKSVLVETHFFINPSKKTMALVEKAAEHFADFLGKDLKINHVLN